MLVVGSIILFIFGRIIFIIIVTLKMADDNDDDDWEDQEALLQHDASVAALYKSFLDEQQQQEQAMVVLAMCSDFGVLSSPNLLTLEALVLFYQLVSCLGHNWRGSSPGKAENIERGRQAGHERLVADYFNGDLSTYTDAQFRRRFHMKRELSYALSIG